MRLVIEQPYGLKDITFIRKHESCVIPPGLWHKFEAIEDTLAIEIYWTEMDPQDIERDGCGGMNDKSGCKIPERPGEVRSGS